MRDELDDFRSFSLMHKPVGCLLAHADCSCNVSDRQAVGRFRDRSQHSPNAVGSIDRLSVPVARFRNSLCGARNLVDEVMLREAPLLERAAASACAAALIRAHADTLERFVKRFDAGGATFVAVVRRGTHVCDSTQST